MPKLTIRVSLYCLLQQSICINQVKSHILPNACVNSKLQWILKYIYCTWNSTCSLNKCASINNATAQTQPPAMYNMWCLRLKFVRQILPSALFLWKQTTNSDITKHKLFSLDLKFTLWVCTVKMWRSCSFNAQDSHFVFVFL